jgi:predicted transcriptional regulator
MVPIMDLVDLKADEPSFPETEADRQRRLALEADARNPERAERQCLMTLEGLADVDAGRLIDDAAMKAWVDSLIASHVTDPPKSR